MLAINLPELSIPLTHLLGYLVVVTVCLLLNRGQLGLAATFIFAFYLGFIHNHELILELTQGRMLGTIAYFACGTLILGLAVISFFKKSD